MILGRPRPLLLAAALLLSGLIAGGPAAARARWQLGPVQIATIDGEVAIAKKQYRSRQYLAARATARIVLRRRPDNIGALSFLGWSEYQLGNYRASSRAFSAILRWHPNSPDALIGLGWCNFKLGRLMQSEKNFIAAQPLTVGDQRYVVADGLGWIAFARGKLDRAGLHFRREAEQRRCRDLRRTRRSEGQRYSCAQRGDHAPATPEDPAILRGDERDREADQCLDDVGGRLHHAEHCERQRQAVCGGEARDPRGHLAQGAREQ